MEPVFDQLWDMAEELAGNRLSYVQRSRIQWRYSKLIVVWLIRTSPKRP